MGDASETPRDIALPDLAATRRLGAALAALLRARDVVALRGDLGAGKTELARAILRAAAGDPELIVPSPTFTLVETYDTHLGPVTHFDLYRLDAPDELRELGFEEALADGACLVEWPERAGGLLPADRLDIALTVDDRDGARRATLAGGPSWSDRVARLAAEMARG
ncbi:MAG: tRNA (adenosine(37)-N6)-threonylcarbamoyltransferase complex ATPase subunit type 1 TsaE [Rhodospirillales bacterium]|nr:MAG: tRNA (adenosine(37)-N6)-threonylcarbamoyltransferase complex ATPase subunit type 1 TsaE [Rhodospirillales bacterium]